MEVCTQAIFIDGNYVNKAKGRKTVGKLRPPSDRYGGETSPA
jgi:hypothetical protein